MLAKSPVIDLQSILNPAPHTPWSPALLFITVPRGRETNDVPFQNVHWTIVASQCRSAAAAQQSESAAHTHPPVQSFSHLGQDFPGGSDGFHLPTVQETRVPSLDREDALEKGMATHSSVLAWRIPWIKEPGGLQSTGWQRVRPQSD